MAFSEDFFERQAHNRRASIFILVVFFFFFLFIGFSVDWLYLDAFTPGGLMLPVATGISLMSY